MFFLKNSLPIWRILRLAAGLMLAAIACTDALPGAYDVALAAVAAVLGLTALAGFCPACALVGRRASREGK